MISHDRCRDLLGEYLDQTLDSSEREKVAAHLEGCAPCAQIARQMSAIRATLRDFTPAPAPPMLRQNVRAALQNEQRTARPQPSRQWLQLGWPKLASRQFAWSGTLAFSALALWVLARPFNTTPESFSETGAAPQNSEAAAPLANAPTANAPTANAPAANVPAVKPAVKPDVRQENDPPRPPAPVKSAPPKGKQPASTSGSAKVSPAPRARLETARPSPEILARRPLQSNVQTPRAERPQPSLLAPPPRSAPTFPVPAPIAPKTGAPNRANRSAASAGATTRARGATPGALSPSPARSAPSQPLFQTHAADSAAPSRDDGNRARENEAATRFSLRLKAAPSPQAAASADAISKEASPQIAAPETQREAAGTSSSVAAEAPLASSSGAASRARALRPMQRSAPQNSVEKTSPGDDVAAFSAPNAIVSKASPVNRVSRFELQIQAPRAVSGARIRLELPPEMRLVWPRSPVVWSGDLGPEKPAAISFSLTEARGGEKISVVMEQKLAGGRSRVLETQTLTLPAPERPSLRR